MWKLKFKDFAIRDAITVSEGLNSVETFSRFSIIPQMIEVSEGLNSVETPYGRVWCGDTAMFQKDLIVWKLSPEVAL